MHIVNHRDGANMAIKAVVENLEEVSEGLRENYTLGDDGKYHLSVEGGEDITGLKRALAAERQAAKDATARLKEYGDIDPAKAKELRDKAAAAEEEARKEREARALAEGKIEEVLASRTEAMRREFNAREKSLSDKLEETSSELSRKSQELTDYKIRNEVMAAINEAGVPRKDAMVDILARAKATWRMSEEGTPIAYNTDGTMKLGKDGRSPMTAIEWAQELCTLAPHLFEPSTGGGAKGTRIRNANGSFTQEYLESLSPKEYAALVAAGKI